MSRSNPEAFASYLKSLPRKVGSLREQATALNTEADSIEAILENLNRSKLDCLKLTGSPKLDAALRLSMESSYFGQVLALKAFPVILEKLERMEKEIADWKEGGLMLVDLTSQSDYPLCLQLVVLEVPAKPTLQIVPAHGYFRDIPISVRVPARLLMAWNSNTWVMEMEHCTDMTSANYAVTDNGFRLEMVDAECRASSPITTTFDLTQLLHPNRGTRTVRLAGIVLGEEAIAEHIGKWEEFVRQGHFMGEKNWYLKFLDEFLGAVQGLHRVAA